MMTEREPKRYKILPIHEQMVLNLLYAGLDVRSRIAEPVLPEDTQVVGVYYRWETLTFDFVLESKAWPLVTPGTMIERLGPIEMKVQEVSGRLMRSGGYSERDTNVRRRDAGDDRA